MMPLPSQKLKIGTSAGVDGIYIKLLKFGGPIVKEWLGLFYSFLNISKGLKFLPSNRSPFRVPKT